MTYKYVSLCCVVALGGCMETLPKVPEKVFVEVSVPCLKQEPSKVALRSDAELLAMDQYRRTIAMWDERREMRAEIDRQHAALLACVGGR